MEHVNPKVAIITCTRGRHTHLERVVRCMLDQDYTDFIHIIYNNSCSEQRLNSNLPKDKFMLINNCLDLQTKQPYKTLGAIFRDAMSFVPPSVSIVNFADDDDLYLQRHVSEGVLGIERGGKTAYKPKYSYFKSARRIEKLENTLEPSIFVKREHVDKIGFDGDTVTYHLKWLNPLVYSNDIFVDPQGVSTLIYDWSQTLPTFKASGNPNNPDNFKNFEKASSNEGDLIITPSSPREIQELQNQQIWTKRFQKT